MGKQLMEGRPWKRLTKELKPDIVILDVGMSRLNGLDATRQILRDDPLVPIMILTVIDTEQMARAALEAGAKAYVPRTDCGRDLVAAVSELHYGRTFFTPFTAQIVLNGFLKGIRAAKEGLGSLTSREREIVQLLAEGQRQRRLLHSPPECEDGRDPSKQYYAKTECAQNKRARTLCCAQRHCSGAWSGHGIVGARLTDSLRASSPSVDERVG